VKYRIYWDDREGCEVAVVEVEAPNLASACFLAGMQVAQNGDPIGSLEVVRVEVPGEWIEVDLP
jgi:hypothetical protein